MKAIILVAGKGKRLLPLTFSKPKPLFKVLGETVLERLIIALQESGIKAFVFVVNYKEEQIRDFIAEVFPSIDATFVRQTSTLGTADAFLCAKDEIKGEDFFIGVNGDCLYSKTTIERVVNKTKERNIVLAGMPVNDVEKYGIIEVNSNNAPTHIIEKPKPEDVQSNYANIGIYGLPTEILEIIEAMKNAKEFSSRGELELPTAINKLIATKKYQTSLITLNETEYWFDIGYPWSLLEANKRLFDELKEEKIEGEIEPGVHINGKVVIKKNARVRSGAYIEGPVFIDEYADIGPNCYIRKYTYLGKRTRIGNACEVKNSIIYDDTHIAHLSYIGDSVIGYDCNFGAGTITANLRLDDKTIPVTIKGIKEDSKRRKLGVICGDKVKTGISVLFMPGIKVGYDSWVGAGTIVHEDVPNKSIYYVSQQRIIKRKKKQNGN